MGIYLIKIGRHMGLDAFVVKTCEQLLAMLGTLGIDAQAESVQEIVQIRKEVMLASYS